MSETQTRPVKKKIPKRQKIVAARFAHWCDQNPKASQDEKIEMLDAISDDEYLKEQCLSDE